MTALTPTIDVDAEATPAEAEGPAGTPDPVALDPTATPTPESTATATPEPTATPTVEPTTTTIPTEEPTASTVPTEEPTIAPTVEPTVTTVPVVIETGVVVNTDGDPVRCRTGPSTEGGEITTLAEGDAVAIIGEIVGEGEDRWVPVICGDSQAGFIAARFVGSATELPPAPDETMVPDAVEGASVATEDAGEELASTEEGILTDEPVVTEEPVATEAAILPYAVADAADSESSGTAFRTVDGDPATTWQVNPAASPDESWLLLDLGAVLPVERVSIELGSGGSLPPFELWLSEDGSTWWNAAQINGWNLQSGVEYEAPLNLWTRYVMVVVPDVEATGLSIVGGIGELRIWPANEAQSLGGLGSPVTPEPDLEPTEEPVEESATEEPPVLETTEAPPKEPALDESESGIPAEGTAEDTPPAQG